MMFKKTFALGVTAVLILCAAPLMTDDSDATITERIISDLYVGETTYQPYEYWNPNGMVFIDGSEKHKMMKEFVNDPYHASIPNGDDLNEIKSSGIKGMKLYIYGDSMPGYTYSDSDMRNTYVTLNGSKLLDHSNISFFVKEGDKFDLNIIDVNAYGKYNGKNVTVMEGIMSDTLTSGSTISNTYGSNTVVSLRSYHGCYATDITYEVSGYILPNGSSTMFIVAAFVIAATIIAILVMCRIHPRWAN